MSDEQIAERMANIIIEPGRGSSRRDSSMGFVARTTAMAGSPSQSIRELPGGRRRSVQDMHFDAIVGLAATINKTSGHLKDILTYHKLSAVKVRLSSLSEPACRDLNATCCCRLQIRLMPKKVLMRSLTLKHMTMRDVHFETRSHLTVQGAHHLLYVPVVRAIWSSIWMDQSLNDAP